MKIVKLDKRHKLYHAGFRIALRFDSYTHYQNSKVYRILVSMYSSEYGEYGASKDRQWDSHWGSLRKNLPRLYWIGLRNEADVSMLVLGTTA